MGEGNVGRGMAGGEGVMELLGNCMEGEDVVMVCGMIMIKWVGWKVLEEGLKEVMCLGWV